MAEFNENERRTYDTRYKLLVNIQLGIRIYQNFLLSEYLKKPGIEKIQNDFKALSRLEATLSSYDTNALNQIYHDLSLKVTEVINAK